MRHFLYDNRDEKSKREFYDKLKALQNGEYVVTIEKNSPTRSIKQNRYYRAVLRIIAISTGEYDEDRLHETCKKKFNGELLNFPKSGSEMIGKSTSKMSTTDFNAYINRVKMWALDEYNITIVDQKDMTLQQWYEIDSQYKKTFSGW